MQHPVKPKPLKNTGTNCYLNSTLQAISACDKFMKDVKVLYESYGTKLDRLVTFYELICVLNDVNRKAIEISHNKIFQHWNKIGQQDCFELLSYILNQVYNQIKAYKIETKAINSRNVEEWLIMPLPMRIIIDYTMYCSCGEVIKLPLQSDFALHIAIPLEKNIDLQGAINDFFKHELINDVECNRKDCLKKEVVKLTKLYFVPDTICIHLQKTRWNGSKLVKIKNRINFIKDLTIYSEFRSSNTDNEECFGTETGKDILLRNKIFSQDKNYRYAFQPSSLILDELKQNQCGNFENEDHKFVKIKKQNSNCKNDKKNRTSKIIEILENPTNKSKISEKVDYVRSLSIGDAIDNISKYRGNDQQILNSTAAENEISLSNIDGKTEKSLLENGNYSESSKNFDFILKSVIVHKGSVKRGHYVCYKNINKQWFLANDSKITKVQEADVYNSEAYVLFYEKLGIEN